jgi:hypothetical protein
MLRAELAAKVKDLRDEQNKLRRLHVELWEQWCQTHGVKDQRGDDGEEGLRRLFLAEDPRNAYYYSMLRTMSERLKNTARCKQHFSLVMDWDTYLHLFKKRLSLSVWNRKRAGEWLQKKGQRKRKNCDAEMRYVENLSPFGPVMCVRHNYIHVRGDPLWDWLCFQAVHLSKISGYNCSVIKSDDLLVVYYVSAEFGFDPEIGKSTCKISFSWATRCSGSGEVCAFCRFFPS